MSLLLNETNLLLAALGDEETSSERLSERLDSIGGMHALSWTGTHILSDILTVDQCQCLERILEIAKHLICPPTLEQIVDDAAAVASFFRPRLAFKPTESFWALFLDARGHPVGFECIAEGTLTACLVHPREVFGAAIKARAAQIVLVHNHPSGDPSPSEEDYNLTERMVEAGALLGIPVVDHVIVARKGYQSVANGHWMPRLSRRDGD